MNKIIKKLREEKLDTDQIAIVWLGQAGFLIKDSENFVITWDPYLSHAGEKMLDFIRMSPSIIDPEELEVDGFLITHKHFDHLDPETVPTVAKKFNPKFYAPIACINEMEKMDINLKNTTLMTINTKPSKITDNISVKAVYADHGELEPDAVGYLLAIGNINIYITGDTGFRPDMMLEMKDTEPDIIIPPINGAFGNLNNSSSIDLAKYSKAKHMIPCHFWTFLEHLGNPELLEEEKYNKDADTVIDFLSPGEIYKFTKGQKNKIKRELI